MIPFRHSCLATDCYSWVCWFLRHRGGPVYYPRVLYSFWKKESTKERKKRSKVTWERIYMCIPVYLIWSIFSRCGWPSVYKRYTHIGSHALSPLRELPLSGCDPPESFQQEEGKNLNNRKMEKKKNTKSNKILKREKYITADRSLSQFTSHPSPVCTENIYKCIEINRSLYVRNTSWRVLRRAYYSSLSNQRLAYTQHSALSLFHLSL